VEAFVSESDTVRGLVEREPLALSERVAHQGEVLLHRFLRTQARGDFALQSHCCGHGRSIDRTAGTVLSFASALREKQKCRFHAKAEATLGRGYGVE
jgi:hypothetical protein